MQFFNQQVQTTLGTQNDFIRDLKSQQIIEKDKHNEEINKLQTKISELNTKFDKKQTQMQEQEIQFKNMFESQKQEYSDLQNKVLLCFDVQNCVYTTVFFFCIVKTTFFQS